MNKYDNTKYELFASDLERQIAQGILKAGPPLPSIRSLMSTNRLSMSTVVKGLALLESRGLLSRHHGRGYFLADGHGMQSSISQIAFITPAVETDTNLYLRGISNALTSDQFAVSTYSACGEAKKYQSMLEQVVRIRPAGIIMGSVAADIFSVDVSSLADSGIPVVLIGPSVKGLNCDRVFLSGRENGRKITKYLLSRGCEDFSVLTLNPLDDPDSVLTGVRMELMAAGKEFTDRQAFFHSSEACPGLDIQQMMEGLLATGIRFKTLICSHDFPAVHAWRALISAGLRVPQDVVLVSGLRGGLEGAAPVKLTTIDSHHGEQARIATELLLRRISGHDGPPEIHYVTGDLIEGETV